MKRPRLAVSRVQRDDNMEVFGRKAKGVIVAYDTLTAKTKVLAAPQKISSWQDYQQQRTLYFLEQAAWRWWKMFSTQNKSSERDRLLIEWLTFSPCVVETCRDYVE